MSLKLPTLIAAAALLLLVPARAQEPAAPPPAKEDEEVVRISTNLVQVDAVVTDKGGRHVSDLKPEDFEVLEDGRVRQISNFSYVSNETPSSTSGGTPGATHTPADGTLPPSPPSRLSRGQVRRTIALVVDDLGLSFDSMGQMRRALRKFVAEQMREGDLVAVLRTGSDMGALQQFTDDKRLLYQAIERVRWNICSRSGISTLPAVREGAIVSDVSRCGFDSSAAETLRALRFVVQGMRELPGRKSLIILSDGIPTEQQEMASNSSDPNERLRQGAFAGAGELTKGAGVVSYIEPLRRVAELAVRSSVVIYGIDARGVQPVLMATAADDFSGVPSDKRDEIIRRRALTYRSNVDGPESLARQTGGLMIQGTNDVADGLRRIVEDQKGYYLLGYQPGGDTFDRRFHRIKVRVKRKGLTVRTRAGFYGISEEDADRVLTPRDQTLAALASPFGRNDMESRLTALYADDARGGRVLRSFLHVEGGKLTFTDEADGWRRVTFDVTAVLFGDNGRVAGEHSQTETVRVRGEAYETIMRDGLVEVFSVPLKRAGVYQLRVALRDTASGRIGTAGQFVEVPDLNDDSLALSGLILSGSDYLGRALGQFNGRDAQTFGNEAAAEGPAVRRLRLGTTPGYALYIYNARAGEGARPRLKVRTRLLRDGKQVYDSGEKSLDLDPTSDPRRILYTSRLLPEEKLQPAEYGLQVDVTDTLAKGRRHTATQSIDFEIVK